MKDASKVPTVAVMGPLRAAILVSGVAVVGMGTVGPLQARSRSPLRNGLGWSGTEGWEWKVNCKVRWRLECRDECGVETGLESGVGVESRVARKVE